MYRCCAPFQDILARPQHPGVVVVDRPRPMGSGQDPALRSRYGVGFGKHGCGRDRCSWLAGTLTDELGSAALLLTCLMRKEIINRPRDPRSCIVPLSPRHLPDKTGRSVHVDVVSPSPSLGLFLVYADAGQLSPSIRVQIHSLGALQRTRPRGEGDDIIGRPTAVPRNFKCNHTTYPSWSYRRRH